MGGIGVADVPVTGCLARGEARVGVTRTAYKPAPPFLLAPPSRFDEGRKPTRAGPPGNRGAHHRLTPREGVGRSGPAGESQSWSGPTRQPAQAGNGRSGWTPRGVRSPAFLARGGVWLRFDAERLRGPAFFTLCGVGFAKGREARGAAERGHGQDAPFRTHPAGCGGGAGGWRTQRSRGAT